MCSRLGSVSAKHRFAIPLAPGRVQDSNLPCLQVPRRTDGAPLSEVVAQLLST